MKTYSLIIAFFLLILTACHKDKNNANSATDINNTVGFNVISKVKGIWGGSVVSTTSLGNFPEWVVDFRPISENHIEAKSELDSLNYISMSFFIAKYNNEYRVAFRNGGPLGGMHRVSYFLADSVSENATESYFRFSEVLKGTKKAYVEIITRGDSLYLLSYTNKSNSLPQATLHSAWSAKRMDATSCQDAVNHFSFPKKTLTVDLSNAFDGMQESIFYSLTTNPPVGEPYPLATHPYLGATTANFSFASSYTPNPSKNVFLIVTTQPLFSGISYNPSALNTRSRYVILSAAKNNFTFTSMHPGSYYFYALYDNDGNNTINSGDWISLSNAAISLGDKGTTSVNTQINFTIP